jgi:hypothetical protein
MFSVMALSFGGICALTSSQSMHNTLFLLIYLANLAVLACLMEPKPVARVE